MTRATLAMIVSTTLSINVWGPPAPASDQSPPQEMGRFDGAMPIEYPD